MKFYTSDLHFGHKNIIKYEDRPFSSVEEMDEFLVDRWNKKVSVGDEVYILGDFGFIKGKRANELLDRLNGRKYLIRGNHDSSFLNDKLFDKAKFEWIKDYCHINDDGKIVCLFHYPIAVWDRQHHGSIHLYGHVHSNKDNHHPLLHRLNNAYNVGCDVWNLEPVTLKEILDRPIDDSCCFARNPDGVVYVTTKKHMEEIPVISAEQIKAAV